MDERFRRRPWWSGRVTSTQGYSTSITRGAISYWDESGRYSIPADTESVYDVVHVNVEALPKVKGISQAELARRLSASSRHVNIDIYFWNKDGRDRSLGGP